MRNVMSFPVSLSLLLLFASPCIADKKDSEPASARLSPSTQACIACHSLYTPGIVHDWFSSRHSRTTPVDAVKKPAPEFLIDATEQGKRLNSMKTLCNGCHNRDWINGHFAKLASTVRETDAMTKAATDLVLEAWSKGMADRSNPFDEPIEQRWTMQWLFFANSVRYASAMTGAPDYASFKHGWWDMTNNLAEMKEMIGPGSSMKRMKATK